MPEAVIVSAARTPIGRAFRGAFNQTHGATLAGHAIAHAVERAGIEPGEVEDVILGVGLPEGATGNNLGRVAALRAGLPIGVPGVTVNRYCASGLQSIAMAAGRILADGSKIVVAGGCESISMVQNVMNVHNFTEEWMLRHEPDVYMPMLQTADAVAKHYKISREKRRTRTRSKVSSVHGGRASRRPVRRGDRAVAVVEVRRDTKTPARSPKKR